MTTMVNILEWSKTEFIETITITQVQDQGLIDVRIKINSQQQHVLLSGFDGLAESISCLLLAEQVIISQETGTWKDYGTVNIEVWRDGCYEEFCCDTIKILTHEAF